MTPRHSEAEVCATSAIATTFTSDSNDSNSTVGEVIWWIQCLEEEVMEIRERLSCARCSTPAPPPARWPGDLWARDSRPPKHTCGRWS
jgi:hypothetical protein